MAQAKRQTILATSEQEWQMWRHNPITAAYLQFLADHVESARNLAADYVETGSLKELGSQDYSSLHRIRGEIMLLRQLHTLELGAIHRFYGKEEPVDGEEQPA